MHLIAITSDARLLLCTSGNSHTLPTTDLLASLPCISRQFNFSSDNQEFTAVAIDSSYVPVSQRLQLIALRDAALLIPPTLWQAAAKGRELTHWDITTKFCSRCCDELTPHSPISKICPQCRAEYFPPLSPAIIVLVRKGNEALLVHARNFTRPFFGLVAGFVETGESLEEAVTREVMEETSLRITNLRYFGSQSWPYPSTLMLAFTADYAGGELKFADGELSDGGFFSPKSLPQLPSPPSISRQLIDAWLAEAGS